MRRCGMCGETKPLHDFMWRYKARGLRDNYCRPCRAIYKKQHYARNKERYVHQALRWKKASFEERSRMLVDYFSSHPCVDCGESDPVVLEFDHLGGKSFDVGTGVWNRSWESVLKEMEKCEVVCVNCHRRRTARRSQSHRFLAVQRMLARPSDQ